VAKQRLLPIWFHIWFIASCLILLVGGAADRMQGATPDSFNAWGAALGMLCMYGILQLIWRLRIPVRGIMPRGIPLILLSAGVGLLFAEIDELVNFPFNPLVPGISLGQDILLSAPMYLGAHLMWYLVLKRYRFSPFQALMTGGLSLGIYEFFLGTPSLLAFLTLPFMLMIHGVHMVIPTVVLGDRYERPERKDTWVKYPLGVLLPAVGTAIGIGVALIFAA